MLLAPTAISDDDDSYEFDDYSTTMPLPTPLSESSEGAEEGAPVALVVGVPVLNLGGARSEDSSSEEELIYLSPRRTNATPSSVRITLPDQTFASILLRRSDTARDVLRRCCMRRALDAGRYMLVDQEEREVPPESDAQLLSGLSVTLRRSTSSAPTGSPMGFLDLIAEDAVCSSASGSAPDDLDSLLSESCDVVSLTQSIDREVIQVIVGDSVAAEEYTGVATRAVPFYQLLVISADGADEWVVLRRYSQFQRLRAQVQEQSGAALEFPKRRPRALKDRRAALQRFIDRVCAEHSDLRAFSEFLDPLFEPCAKACHMGHVLYSGHLDVIEAKKASKRYVVLLNTMLFYFRSADSDAALGSMPIDYIKVDAVDRNDFPFCFSITHLVAPAVVFACASEERRSLWIEIVREARTRKMKPAGRPAEKRAEAAEGSALRASRELRLEKSARLLKGLARNSFRLSGSCAIPDLLSSTLGASHFQVQDSNQNIVYKGDLVSCGLMTKLIQKLTEPEYKQRDAEYLDVFLVTYRAYMDAQDLLVLLSSRFHYQMSKGGALQRDPVMVRVCAVLERWVTSQMYDFQEDPELTKKLLSFVFSALHENVLYDVYAKKLRKAVKDTIHRKAENMAKAQARSEAQPTIVPHLFDVATASILDIDPLEIARQFTLIDEMVFHKIVPSKDLLGQKWSKPATRSQVPNVMLMIKRFNHLSSWASAVVLQCGSVEQRAAMMSTLVLVARQLLLLRNFSGASALLAGMRSNAVLRLKRSHAAMPPQAVQQREAMRETLLDPSHNHSAYRGALAAAKPPCIPYLGRYLSDLTYIEDGNPDYRNDMINFDKCRMLGKILLQISWFQSFHYPILAHKGIQRVLASVETYSEEDAYQISLEREPRE